MYNAKQWPCVLVQDPIEQDRLVSQHYLLRTAFQGDFHAPVHAGLKAKEGGDGFVALDIGCGRGHWTMEMATTYPQSTFIGLDHQSTFPKDIKPRNCHFFQVDVRLGPLPFPDESVDFIYQRDMTLSLHQDDWIPLILEYQRILKPGGWIELVEPDVETKSSMEKEYLLNDHLIRALTARGQDPYVARRLPILLANHGYRRVESHFQSLLLGWGQEDNKRDRHARRGQAMASQYMFYLRSLGPWLRLVMGMSLAKYVEYVNQLPDEWHQAQTYINWHCATAQKPLHPPTHHVH
ncbi:S-adenosyl-L-methionine-dependent methyltransferase [Hesseltinella vesiculosa]|uniref:S-adenosyl-L-methionine-dependent methyltransferase n=1 Tax=Hesseltinella vesiculosa TaxID=101127 RepID=A0A1X2G9S0_9FUNG|nr:S-adenosyl-L-methionine-dependent methyltransferase [Hesseltinella vesiculosa]